MVTGIRNRSTGLRQVVSFMCQPLYYRECPVITEYDGFVDARNRLDIPQKNTISNK
jgi:hypothetical protein